MNEDRQTPTLSENHKQLTQCSTPIPTSLSNAEARLRPATASAGNAELLACLTLVAPSGMSAEDRNAWAQVARATLSGIPADLLAYGCKIARQKCRFPSEIVPTIMESTKTLWDLRVEEHERERRAFARQNNPLPQIEDKRPEYVRAAEVRKLISSLVKVA